MTGSCEHGDELSGYIKEGELFSSLATTSFSLRIVPYGVGPLKSWFLF